MPQDRSIRVAEPLRDDGARGRLIVKLRKVRPPTAVDFLSKTDIIRNVIKLYTLTAMNFRAEIALCPEGDIV